MSVPTSTRTPTSVSSPPTTGPAALPSCFVHTHVDAVPALVFVVRRATTARERVFEHHELADLGYVEFAPAGHGAVALTANLVNEEFRHTAPHPVVVRLDNAAMPAVDQLDEAPLADGGPDLAIDHGQHCRRHEIDSDASRAAAAG